LVALITEANKPIHKIEFSMPTLRYFLLLRKTFLLIKKLLYIVFNVIFFSNRGAQLHKLLLHYNINNNNTAQQQQAVQPILISAYLLEPF